MSMTPKLKNLYTAQSTKKDYVACFPIERPSSRNPVTAYKFAALDSPTLRTNLLRIGRCTNLNRDPNPWVAGRNSGRKYGSNQSETRPTVTYKTQTKNVVALASVQRRKKGNRTRERPSFSLFKKIEKIHLQERFSLKTFQENR